MKFLKLTLFDDTPVFINLTQVSYFYASENTSKVKTCIFFNEDPTDPVEVQETWEEIVDMLNYPHKYKDFPHGP